MHTFVLSAVVSVWTFAVSSVDGALLTITYSGSNRVDSTTYKLKCEIPTFNSQAVWSRGGASMSSCFNSGCLTTSTPPYTFRHDSTAIYVDFSSLAASENGIQWTCEHIGDTAANFIVAVDTSVETTEGLTEGTSTTDDLEPEEIVGIVFGGMAFIVVVISISCFAFPPKSFFCFATSSKSPAIQREVSADAGSEVKLLPELRNIDNIKSVEWKHSGKTVQTGYENELMQESGTIPWVSRKDSGFWLCKLKIENETEQNFVIQLNVTVHQYEEEEGMRVQLLNYIKTSQSFQRVQWYHGKSKISGNEKKYQGGTIQVPALFVGKLEKEDAGEYTCEIVLKKATLQIPVELAVKSTNGNSSLPPLGPPGLQTAHTATS